jgi:predicted ribosome-associated RNA-binding protein Tma20
LYFCVFRRGERPVVIGPLLASKKDMYMSGKGKVVPVLNLIKHYAIKAYGGVDV